MNDPLRIDQAGGAAKAFYGTMATVIVFCISVVWEGSNMAARFDARLTALEQQQTLSRALEEKLNEAREESNNHLTHLDDQMVDMSGKLSAVLEILQQPDQPSMAGGTQSGGQNFTRIPAHGP